MFQTVVPAQVVEMFTVLKIVFFGMFKDMIIFFFMVIPPINRLLGLYPVFLYKMPAEGFDLLYRFLGLFRLAVAQMNEC